MIRRAAIEVAFLVTLVSALASAPAQAQSTADASPSTPADQTSCLGQSLGSDCNSSTTTGGGTCLAGCCCRYVTSPEGAQVCEACLACSDTSNKDPEFATGPCSDGGAIGVPDSGVVAIVDSGDSVLAPGSTSTPASNGGCACASVGAPEGTMSLGALLLGALVVAGVRTRARGRRS